MTITERNQRLYELRKQLDAKRLELAWIETEIMAVNSKYEQENSPDFMNRCSGKDNTLWSHLEKTNS